MSYKIGMVSLGCPKNQVDAELMLKKLVDAGYILVQEADKADIVIVDSYLADLDYFTKLSDEVPMVEDGM